MFDIFIFLNNIYNITMVTKKIESTDIRAWYKGYVDYHSSQHNSKGSFRFKVDKLYSLQSE